MESALLFIRSTEYVPRALEAANTLLARRRRTSSVRGEVLGICVDERLDGGLVASSAECPFTAVDGAAFRESVALAGIWSLCWFELAHSVSLSGTDRRRILLDTPELNDYREPGKPANRCLFLAVWTPAEARQDVSGSLHSLKAQYPALEIGSESFVDQPESGVVRLAATRRDSAR